MRKGLLGEVTSHIILTDTVRKKQAIRHAIHSSSLKRNNTFLFRLGTIAMTLNEIFQLVIKPEEKERKRRRGGKKGACLHKRAKKLIINRGKGVMAIST